MKLLQILLVTLLIFYIQAKKKENPIKHVIVLGMENHAYDTMLGYMDAPIGDRQDEQLCNNANGVKYCQREFARYQTTPDPPHNFYSMNFELYGTPNFPSGSQYEPDNSGFAQAYQDIGGYPQDVMDCYSEDQVPIISTLAKEFKTTTNWYCSAPTCTEPNKLFYHAATSNGNLGNSFAEFGQKNSGFPIHVNTIEQNLEKEGYSWEVHWQDWNECLAIYPMGEDLDHQIQDDYYKKFFKQLQDGTLSDYTFLVPRFTWGDIEEGASKENFVAFAPNDQHPNEDVRAGEALIKQVYEALRSSQYWENTLLIITYDENGGFPDHKVPPSNVKNPSPDQETDGDFDWTRLGGRVPGILVSPWLAKGVDETQYEHASIPHTLKHIFKLKSDYLNDRDREANNLLRDEEILDEMRQDCPEKLPEVPSFKDYPIQYRKEFVFDGRSKQYCELVGNLLVNKGFITKEEYEFSQKQIKTEYDVKDYLKEGYIILGYRDQSELKTKQFKFFDKVKKLLLQKVE